MKFHVQFLSVNFYISLVTVCKSSYLPTIPNGKLVQVLF